MASPVGLLARATGLEYVRLPSHTTSIMTKRSFKVDDLAISFA